MKNLVQYLLVIVALSLSSVATGETEVVVGVAADGGYVTKPIAEIEVGDTVLTRDENNPDGPMVQTQVADKLSYQVDHLREITVQSADGTSETIRTTDFHPFFVEGPGWVGAVYLQPGQMLQGPNGEILTVVETTYQPLAQPITVYNLSLAQDHTYFVAEGDGIAGATDAVWVHNAGCNYRATFFDANPELRGQVIVHHAIEQQVLKSYPGLFTEAEIHALENLRGISKGVNSELHLRQIRAEWDSFYEHFLDPTREQFLQKVKEIDSLFGKNFMPPIGG